MIKHKEKVIIEVDKQILVINQGNWLNWKRGGPCGHCGITGKLFIFLKKKV